MRKKVISISLAIVMIVGSGVLPAMAVLYGDTDGDGVINAADVTMVRRYIASGKTPADFKIDNPTFNEENADLFATGEINSDTVTKLRRGLAATYISDKSFAPPPPLFSVTYDDGPTTAYTPLILDFFETLNKRPEVVDGAIAPAHVTFFVNSSNNSALEQWGNPGAAIVQRAVAGGHTVENHTHAHAYLGQNSAAFVREQISITHNRIIAELGKAPWFIRPPYFSHGPSLLGLDKEFNTPLISAGLETDDWAGHSSEKMADFILNGRLSDCGGGAYCKPEECKILGAVDAEGNPWTGARGKNGRGADGGNILFHDGGGTRTATVKTLPLFVEEMQEMGYEFVTIKEHYERKGVTPCWYDGTRVNDWIMPAGKPGGCPHTPVCAPLA